MELGDLYKFKVHVKPKLFWRVLVSVGEGYIPYQVFLFFISVQLGKFPFTSCSGDPTGSERKSLQSAQNSHPRELKEIFLPIEGFPPLFLLCLCPVIIL